MSVLDAIKSQYEKNKSPEVSNTSYEKDFSKYFNPRLEDEVNEGEANIRIMPPMKGQESPFEEGYWHTIKVGEKYPKLYCREKNDGETCPLCETAKDLKATGDDSDKKMSKQFEPKKFYLARVIDRDNEGDGVKIWRFPHNWKNEGVMDKLVPLFTKKGDITNPREGRDITLILNKDFSLSKRGYTKVTSIMSDDVSLLTDPSGPKAKEWMGDETTWKDVYSPQPVDYLQIIADGDIPVWDKQLEKFVAKGEETDVASSESSVKDVTNVVSKPQTTEEDDEEAPF
jgi:hypothetical protein